MNDNRPGFSRDLEDDTYKALDQQDIVIGLTSGKILNGIMTMCSATCLELSHHDGEISLIYKQAIASITFKRPGAA